mgnify:CR=1 FL=1
MSDQTIEKIIDISELEKGAKDFEIFWLRPKKMANKEAILRMQINKKWGGWKLKDGLVESLSLEVGDTINTEVSILNAPGLIEDADDTDLFASGEGADWLLANDIGFGAIIDAKVKFVYAKAPIGGLDGREVWKISLVFVEGYHVVEKRDTKGGQYNSISIPTIGIPDKLSSLFG